MKCNLPRSLAAGAVALFLATGAGQAATLTPAAANAHPAVSAHAPSLVSKAGVRLHRRCWWRNHRRHCRYWR